MRALTIEEHEKLADWLMRLSAAFAVVVVICTLAACQTPVPVNRPCGVITDDLRGVTATDAAGQQRLGIHYVRGKAARCW
jgi:hypothetical protein